MPPPRQPSRRFIAQRRYAVGIVHLPLIILLLSRAVVYCRRRPLILLFLALARLPPSCACLPACLGHQRIARSSTFLATDPRDLAPLPPALVHAWCHGFHGVSVSDFSAAMSSRMFLLHRHGTIIIP